MILQCSGRATVASTTSVLSMIVPAGAIDWTSDLTHAVGCAADSRETLAASACPLMASALTPAKKMVCVRFIASLLLSLPKTISGNIDDANREDVRNTS